MANHPPMLAWELWGMMQHAVAWEGGLLMAVVAWVVAWEGGMLLPPAAWEGGLLLYVVPWE